MGGKEVRTEWRQEKKGFQLVYIYTGLVKEQKSTRKPAVSSSCDVDDLCEYRASTR